LPYLGEGDIQQESIREAIGSSKTALWGPSNKHFASEDDSFKEAIQSTLEVLTKKMSWRRRFTVKKKFDPVAAILGDRSKDFYGSFDDLCKGRISIGVAGPRDEYPFMLFVDENNFVAGMSERSQETLWYGYGLLETWRADPRVHFLDGKGISAFKMFLGTSLVYLLVLYIGLGLTAARKVQKILDPEDILQNNLGELVTLTKKRAWPGSEEIQRKAAIALRGYLNAWFDFMEKSSWLEIHHTLHDTKVLEKEQSFLDTATTEISETARGIVLEQMIGEMFSGEAMERREKERREKQMEWTMLRIALGILYPRKKNVLKTHWNMSKRQLTWKELEETYYEEIWDLMRSHLAGQDLEQKILEKDRGGLGRWHFIFELKRSERPREKVKTLERMGLDELLERKNVLLSMLKWEEKGLPPDAVWDDAITRFRKIIIRYHPDRVEITGINMQEAQQVSTDAIQNFRELEIIHDLQPTIFGMATLQHDSEPARKL
jgi:hypothetical protein